MKIVYHTLCIGLAGFLLVLAEIRGDYGNSQLNTCSLVGTSVSEYVRLGIFAAEIILMWILIFFMRKKVGKTYSNVFFNYFLVIFTMNLSVTIVNLLSFSKYIGLKDHELISSISLAIASSTGLLMGISRLSNKRLIKQILWRVGLKKKKKIVLIENPSINESDSFLSQNIYNLGDLFDNLTKKRLMQILAMVSLRFTSHDNHNFTVENEADYDQFEFDECLFNNLSLHFQMPRIKESIFYLVYHPDLYLLEYKPDVFEKIRKADRINDEMLYS